MVRKRSRILFSGPFDTQNMINFRYFGTTLGFLFLEGFFLVDGWRRRGHALQITNKKTSALSNYLGHFKTYVKCDHCTHAVIMMGTSDAMVGLLVTTAIPVPYWAVRKISR